MIEAALALASRGLAVHPVDATTKRPLTRNGCKDASVNSDVIADWWRMYPDAGVAVATGTRSRLVIIDVDPRHGGEEGIAELTSRIGQLPPTTTVTTPSGGWHKWLKLPAGVHVPNSAGQLAPGVDVRGEGGYCIAPPSRGDRGAWQWAPGCRPLAELEGPWLQALTRHNAHGTRTATPAAEWIALVRDGAPEGSRNHTLARITGHLLAKDVNAHLTLELAHLVNTRNRPPLPGTEVEQIVSSIAGLEVRRRKAGR